MFLPYSQFHFLLFQHVSTASISPSHHTLMWGAWLHLPCPVGSWHGSHPTPLRWSNLVLPLLCLLWLPIISQQYRPCIRVSKGRQYPGGFWQALSRGDSSYPTLALRIMSVSYCPKVQLTLILLPGPCPRSATCPHQTKPISSWGVFTYTHTGFFVNYFIYNKHNCFFLFGSWMCEQNSFVFRKILQPPSPMSSMKNSFNILTHNSKWN